MMYIYIYIYILVRLSKKMLKHNILWRPLLSLAVLGFPKNTHQSFNFIGSIGVRIQTGRVSPTNPLTIKHVSILEKLGSMELLQRH